MINFIKSKHIISSGIKLEINTFNTQIFIKLLIVNRKFSNQTL